MSEMFPVPPAEEPLNPYSAPSAEIGREAAGTVGDISDAESIRRVYLGHEASVKAIGALSVIGGVVVMVAGVISLASSAGIIPKTFPPAGPELFLGVFLGGFGFVTIYIGIGLRRLQPWARWTETAAIVLHVLVNLLVLNMVGVLIGVYILYLMLSAKGEMVFSRFYRTVIEQTPHMRYKMSRLLKLVLILLLIVIGMAAIGGILTYLTGND